MQTRSMELEIMDQPNPPTLVARKFHRDLERIHRLMGNWRAIGDRLERGKRPDGVIDIGCGDGALLQYLRERLGLRAVTGVDLKPPDCVIEGIPVVVADATRDALPRADAAVSVMVLHHLSDEQVVALIRNLGRSVKRFVALDPVRHWLPWVLYTVFICPLLSRVGAQDGRLSIRRSFRPGELRKLVDGALDGTPEGKTATYELWVSPIYARLILDIQWPELTESGGRRGGVLDE